MRRVRATTGDTTVRLVTEETGGLFVTGGAEILRNVVVGGSLLIVRSSTDDVMSPRPSGRRQPGPVPGRQAGPASHRLLSA